MFSLQSVLFYTFKRSERLLYALLGCFYFFDSNILIFSMFHVKQYDFSAVVLSFFAFDASQRSNMCFFLRYKLRFGVIIFLSLLLLLWHVIFYGT